MCELFGLNCNKAVNISFSFTELHEEDRLHDSGWGIGYYRIGEQEKPYATIIKEPISARNSIFNYFLKYGYINSHIFISHFRVASVGAKVPLNTHPFQMMIDPRAESYQEKSWIFAHSGTLKGIKHDRRFLSKLKPHGNTDSEIAFCYLIGRLRAKYIANGYSLPLEEKIEIIETVAHKISEAYPENFNFILSDGYRLYAYYGGYDAENGGRLWYLTRKPSQPKLAMIDQNDGMTIQLIDKEADETATLVASNPLKPTATSSWQPFQVNELKVFEDGEIVK